MADKNRDARRAELMAELEALDNENEEVWIKEGDREYKVTGKRAKTLLDKLLGGNEESGEETDSEEELPKEEAEKPAVSQRYFGKKAS